MFIKQVAILPFQVHASSNGYIFDLHIFRSAESRTHCSEVTAQVGYETRPACQKRKLQNNRGYE